MPFAAILSEPDAVTKKTMADVKEAKTKKHKSSQKLVGDLAF